MSITITTDVFCDRCPMWVHGVTGSGSRSADARRVAKASGWTRRDGRDLCPDCVAETADGKPITPPTLPTPTQGETP